MKQITSISFKILKVSVPITAAVIFAFGILSFTVNRVSGDLWQQLGITQQSGEESIQTGFLRGYLSYYSPSSVRKAAEGNKLAVAQDLLKYTKQYINSEAFKKNYEKERANAKPSAPEAKVLRSKQEIQAEEIAKMEKSLKETEENIKKMDASMQKAMQEVVVALKQQIKEFKDPNNQIFDYMVMGEQQVQENNQKRYEEAMANWGKEFPADCNQRIKSRLQEFLAVTDGIDYNADLKESYGKKRFVNPVYERKDAKWKMGFRAGKDVTEYARSFAKVWMAEIK